MDRLILLERKNPTVYEVHRGEISQERNLIFTTTDKEFAVRVVTGYNLHRTPCEHRYITIVPNGGGAVQCCDCLEIY